MAEPSEEEEDFYACLRDASNACLRARRYIVEAIDRAALMGEPTIDLWNAMDAVTLWADWLSPPGHAWDDNVIGLWAYRKEEVG